MKQSTFLFIALAVFLGIANYCVKQTVMGIEQELTFVQKNIFQHEESIHILKAEWSHLNEPGRLQRLVENHLSEGSLTGIQLTSLDRVPSFNESPPSEDKMVTLASATVP